MSIIARALYTVTFAIWLLPIATATVQAAGGGESPRHVIYRETPPAPAFQSAADRLVKSGGCITCHTETDQASMHDNPAVVLGCTDCHGGDSSIARPPEADPDDRRYRAALDQAHVQPRFPKTWHYPSSANPKRSYTLLNNEAPEYIRFVSPSDYRVVREACGACHLPVIVAAERSLMSTGAMFWGGAAYNNGILPFKRSIVGEAYTRDGTAAIIKSPLAPSEAMLKRGILPSLSPLPAWEVLPPADVFRVFERGGRNILNLFPEIGLPNLTGNIQRLEEPGRPDLRQSNRGFRTECPLDLPWRRYAAC